MNSVDQYTRGDALAGALTAAGWPDDDVAGFAHGNWRRFLERTLR